MKTLVTVARVEPNKRPFDAIEVTRKVRENTGWDVRLIWIGNGVLLPEIQRYIQAQKFKFAQFVGAKKNSEKNEILRNANVYISTSEMEGFNLTIGEALLLGIPVVAYDLPVYHQVYEDTISYVPCFDTMAFAKIVTENLRTPESFKSLIENGRQHVLQCYSPDAVAQNVEKALLEVLHSV